MKISTLSLASIALVLKVDLASARTWRDIIPIEALTAPDHFDISSLLSENNPLNTFPPTADPASSAAPAATPTAWPTLNPTEAPTASPTLVPTSTPTATPSSSPSELPTSAPTPEPYPDNDAPLFADPTYFNYDNRPTAKYGPGHAVMQMSNGFTLSYENNKWGDVSIPSDSYWKEFTNNGSGPWKGALNSRNPTTNRCDRVGNQSPIDLRHNGLANCDEHHEVRSLGGDMKITGDMVQKEIQSNKLRLRYQRRPCADLNNVTCQEPDPPYADFPNGWGGFADALHVDFKIPSEHLIYGKRYDAEMQIYHLHPGRRRLPTQAQVITAEEGGHNWYFEQALLAFEFEYERDLAICAASQRRGRQLVTDVHATLGQDVTSEFADYTTWAKFSTTMDDPRYKQYSEQMERHLQNGRFDPHHPMLVPSIHFYRYDGSLTEPPCGEFVSWFVTDKPMIISTQQLERMKTYLFNHVDPSCYRTSVHYDESVARPVQETSGRPVWLCTPADFGPDP